jgi:hypothetical protein
MQSKAKQSKAKQRQAKQSKAKQSKASILSLIPSELLRVIHTWLKAAVA